MYFKIYGGDICHVIACGSIRANSSKFEDRLRKLVLGFYHYHIGFQRKYATLDFNLLSWLELFTRYLCNVFLAQLWGPKQPRKSRDPKKVIRDEQSQIRMIIRSDSICYENFFKP